MNTNRVIPAVGYLSASALAFALSLVSSSEAWAAEPDIRAGLRLPELASERPDEQLSEAVFTSLTPFTIEEVPVRLPADQSLDNEPRVGKPDTSQREPNAR